MRRPVFPFGLPFSLGLSLFLHGLVLYAGSFVRFPDPLPQQVMLAVLRVPEKPQKALPQAIETISDADPLLKNTMEARQNADSPPPEALTEEKTASKTAPSPKNDAPPLPKKLSENIFYPREAIERGLEGTVQVTIRFADDRSILKVSVAVSSGHALLDAAAVQAVYAFGRQLSTAAGELTLPIQFRLED